MASHVHWCLDTRAGAPREWMKPRLFLDPLPRYVLTYVRTLRIRIYVRTYVRMYVRMYVRVYIRVRVRIRTYVRTYIYTCVLVRTYVRTYMYIVVSVCAYVPQPRGSSNSRTAPLPSPPASTTAMQWQDSHGCIHRSRAPIEVGGEWSAGSGEALQRTRVVDVISLSKRLSGLLRYHTNADRHGLHIYAGGWAQVEEVSWIVGESPETILPVIATSRNCGEPRFEVKHCAHRGMIMRATTGEFISNEDPSNVAPTVYSADSSGIKRMKRRRESADGGTQPMKRRRDSADGGESECVVCMDMPRQFAMVPCGHLCLCERCKDNHTSCPICRSTVDKTLRVYV